LQEQLKCSFGAFTKWRTLKLFDRFKCESKMKTTKKQGVGARSLARNTLGVEGRVETSRWDYEKWQALNHSHESAQTKQQVG
jgi:hypothetical protein